MGLAKPNNFLLRHHFYLPKVIIHIQNGTRVLNRLGPCPKCIETILLSLDLYFYPKQVSINDDKELKQFGFSGFNKLSVLPNLQISLLNHFRRLLRLHVNPFKVGSQLVKKPFVSKIFFVMVFTTPTSLSIFLSNKFPCMLQAQKLSVLYLLKKIKTFT